MTNTPNEILGGASRITVDIVDRDEIRVGPGPLVSCLSFECDSVLSQPGRFTARFPANDPALAYLQLKRHFLDFYLDENLIFYGMAEEWRHEINEDGQHTLVVTGRDTLAELGESNIQYFEVEEDAEPVFDAPARIILYDISASGWGISGYTTTLTGVYGGFAGEVVLEALTRIANHIGEAFRLQYRRTLHWINTSEPSTIRAVQGAGDPIEAEGNPDICFIQRLTERRDASRMMTKIYPYGSGIGDAQLDLAGTSKTAPVGFTLNEAENSISSDAALAYVGAEIGRRISFKDIRPLYNTDADVEAAKDYLFEAALALLKRNDSVDDVVEYELDVVQLPPRLMVGMSIRVVYQDDTYSLDDDLIVLGIRRNVNGSNVSYGLTVAPINQWRLRETHNVAAQVEEGEIFSAHPQIDGNSYWENFREEIGESQTLNMAEMPFVLGPEVVTVKQVVFRYKVETITGLVKSYTIAPTTGDSSATNSGTNNGDTGTNNGNTGTSNVNTSDVSVTITTTGATDIGDTLSATIATRNDSSGTSAVTVYTEPNYNDIGEATQTPTNYAPDPSIHHHNIGGHVHDMSLHQHVYSHDHPVAAEHGHTSPTHNHTLNNHVHTLNNHVHTLNNHVHTIAHHHPAPALNYAYAMEVVDVINSYALGDLEYSVNGGTWALLSTGIPTAFGYREIDITSEVQNPDGKRRPYQEDNYIQVRRTTAAGTGKTALIRVKLGVRTTIQSVAIFS